MENSQRLRVETVSVCVAQVLGHLLSGVLETWPLRCRAIAPVPVVVSEFRQKAQLAFGNWARSQDTRDVVVAVDIVKSKSARRRAGLT